MQQLIGMQFLPSIVLMVLFVLACGILWLKVLGPIVILIWALIPIFVFK